MEISRNDLNVRYYCKAATKVFFYDFSASRVPDQELLTRIFHCEYLYWAWCRLVQICSLRSTMTFRTPCVPTILVSWQNTVQYFQVTSHCWIFRNTPPIQKANYVEILHPGWMDKNQHYTGTGLKGSKRVWKTYREKLFISLWTL